MRVAHGRLKQTHQDQVLGQRDAFLRPAASPFEAAENRRVVTMLQRRPLIDALFST
jgi:hypothetical protein